MSVLSKDQEGLGIDRSSVNNSGKTRRSDSFLGSAPAGARRDLGYITRLKLGLVWDFLQGRARGGHALIDLVLLLGTSTAAIFIFLRFRDAVNLTNALTILIIALIRLAAAASSDRER